MKRKQVLFHYGRHESPMTAVLKRYGIGSADKYGRGFWVTEADLHDVDQRIREDDSHIVSGNIIAVMGTNRHNYVAIEDFWRVFNGRTA